MPCSSGDRKSTRLNSSHSQISYAVFCLKKERQSPRTWTRRRSAPPPTAGLPHAPARAPRRRPLHRGGAARRSAVQSRRVIFCFNDTATTEIYTLSLHDALPILLHCETFHVLFIFLPYFQRKGWGRARDRKSTRLNSSHSQISYAVFCLTKE